MPIDMSQHLRWSALFKFTLPTIAMTVFTSLYSIIDGLFVSNMAGKDAFAAVNLAMPFVLILSPLGFMVGTGGSALISKVRGEGDELRANRYFSFLVYALAGLGTTIAIIGFISMEALCASMGASGTLLAQATLYGRILMIALPFYMMQFAFQSFFVAAGKPNLGLRIALLAGGLNIALDAWLIGGLHWGVAGAAIATTIAQSVGAITALMYFAHPNNSYLHLGKTRPQWRALGKSCVNGSSEFMIVIATSIVGMLYNYQLMAYVGPEGVAAYGVIMYAATIFTAVFEGYSIGSSPLMSYQYGAGNTREMRSILGKSLVFVGIGGAISLTLSQTLAPVATHIFVGYDPALADFTVNTFRIYSVAFLLMGMSIYGSAFFTSLNNGLVSAVLALLRTLVFECGSVLILPAVLGIGGIWISIIVAESASLAITAIFMLTFGKRYGYLGVRREAVLAS